MKIAVILPTRGLVFTEVEEALEETRKSVSLQVFRSNNKPIPDAQNYLVEKALETDATHLWFVEEDTVPPKNALAMLSIADIKSAITCVDYAVNGYSCTARDRATDEILWCGFGCTLVRREVFEAMEAPYFRTDKTLRLNDWEWINKPAKYGGQDIWFCMKARSLGFKITQIPGECEHLSLVVFGAAGSNEGEHFIQAREKITKQQYIDIPSETYSTERMVI